MLYEVAKGKGFSKPRGILIHEDELYDWYWLMVTSKLVCQSMDIEIKIRISF
jgi:hypothetical protein